MLIFVHVYPSPPLYSLFDEYAEEGGKLEVDKNDKSALCSCEMLSNVEKKRQARRVQFLLCTDSRVEDPQSGYPGDENCPQSVLALG